jgi:hypothetical protein
MIVLTDWFNASKQPPLREGEYEFRDIAEEDGDGNKPMTVFRAEWKMHEIRVETRNERGCVVGSIVYGGWLGQFEWRGVRRFACTGCGRECFDPHADLMALREGGAISCCPERSMQAKDF